MKTTTATALALLAALGLALPAAAQQQQEGQSAQQQSGAPADSGTEVTGIVTSVDDQTHELVIDGENYVMPEQSGTAMMPAPGDKVTLFYEEQDGQKVITRIGQPVQ